jgi:hypothetical protein
LRLGDDTHKLPTCYIGLSENAAGSVAYHLNKVEYLLARRQLEDAAVLIDTLKKWEAKNNIFFEDVHDKSMWRLFQKSIFTLEFVKNCLIYFSPGNDATDAGRDRLSDNTWLSLDSIFHTLLESYNVDKTNYTNDITRLYHEISHAFYLKTRSEDKSTETDADVYQCLFILYKLYLGAKEDEENSLKTILEEIRKLIKDRRNSWYFSNLESYPKLLLRQGEDFFKIIESEYTGR